MNFHEKSKKELIQEYQELLHEHETLKASYEKDFTQRKLAEADLSVSEDRFKQVAESTGVWIWEVDAKDYIPMLVLWLRRSLVILLRN